MPTHIIDALPLEAVGEIHLAGFTRDADALGAPLLIDSHGSPVDDAVWALYGETISRVGPMPSLLERDNDIPAFATLLAEAHRADGHMRSATGQAAARLPLRSAA